MLALDFIVISIILGLGLLGFKRGFIKELIDTVGAIIAAMVSFKYYHSISEWLSVSDNGEPWSKIFVFIGFFIGIMICFSLIGYLVRKFINAISLKTYDHLAGFVLGAVKGSIVAAALSLAILLFSPNGEKNIENSKFARSNFIVLNSLVKFLPVKVYEKYGQLIAITGSLENLPTSNLGLLPIVNLNELSCGIVSAVSAQSIPKKLIYTINSKEYGLDIIEQLQSNKVFIVGTEVSFDLVYLPDSNKVFADNLSICTENNPQIKAENK